MRMHIDFSGRGICIFLIKNQIVVTSHIIICKIRFLSKMNLNNLVTIYLVFLDLTSRYIKVVSTVWFETHITVTNTYKLVIIQPFHNIYYLFLVRHIVDKYIFSYLQNI